MTRPPEVEQGIARLEGYLLCQTELTNARAEAEAFARRLTWLTTAQHEEVVRLYTDERIKISRRTLERIIERSRELQTEYAARYEQLRQRLLCTCVALVLAALALCSCMLIMSLS